MSIRNALIIGMILAAIASPIGIFTYLYPVTVAPSSTAPPLPSPSQPMQAPNTSAPFADLLSDLPPPVPSTSNISQPNNNETDKANEDPLLIIKQRLARGEITTEEYETLREILER